MPIPAPTCRGFVLAYNVAAPAEGAVDPYNFVPCPHPPCMPAIVSQRCVQSTKKSCIRAAYCELHHCGACKKALRLKQDCGAGAKTGSDVPAAQQGLKEGEEKETGGDIVAM